MEYIMSEVNREVIENVLNKMACDYANWSQRAQEIAQYDHNQKKVWVHWYDEYKVATEFKIGRTYVKLIHKGSAKGFIVISKKDKKFEYGDLLMAASWAAPARNFARGNVFTNMPDVIQWTGF
jgi:hypothetical protein